MSNTYAKHMLNTYVKHMVKNTYVQHMINICLAYVNRNICCNFSSVLSFIFTLYKIPLESRSIKKLFTHFKNELKVNLFVRVDRWKATCRMRMLYTTSYMQLLLPLKRRLKKYIDKSIRLLLLTCTIVVFHFLF